MSFETVLHSIKSALDINVLTLAGTPISFATALTFLIFLIGSVRGSTYLARLFGKSDFVRRHTDNDTRDTIQRMLRLLILWLGLAFSFGVLGVDLAALFTAGAVFAVGVGFALQNIARDLVSGFMLSIERKIKSGDVLQVDGKLVRVMDMGMRSTLVRTLDEEEVILPNTRLISQAVTNYTHNDSLLRVRAKIVTPYEGNLSDVMDVIETAAGSLAGQSEQISPRVLIEGFSERGVCFDVSIWMTDPWALPTFQSDLYETVWWALHENDMKVAHPQLDISVKTPLHAAPTSSTPPTSPVPSPASG